jgi:hypothetical protein
MKHVNTYEPSSSVAQFWNMLVFFCWVHELFFVPFIAGFTPQADHSMYTIIDLLCDAVLASHALYMAPRIQKIIEGELVTDFNELFRYYMTSEFYVDVIGGFPLATLFEIYCFVYGTPRVAIELYLSLLRLSKLILFLRLLDTMNKTAVRLSTHVNSAYFRILTQVLLIYMVTHWVGCGWVFLTNYYGYGSDDFVMSAGWEIEKALKKYEYAMFWGLKQMTGGDTGTGAPETRVERFFSFFITLAGISIYASIISSLSDIVRNVNEEEDAVHAKIEMLNNYMRRKKVCRELRSRITSYMEYKLHRDHDEEEKRMLDELPEKLKAELILNMNRSLIMKVPFLARCSTSIMNELSLRLKPTHYAPNEYIFHAGEVSNIMYFICKGQVHISTATGVDVATLGTGCFVGEMELLDERPKEMNVKSLSFCDTLGLTKADLFEVAERFGGSFLTELRLTAQARQSENAKATLQVANWNDV